MQDDILRKSDGSTLQQLDDPSSEPVVGVLQLLDDVEMIHRRDFLRIDGHVGCIQRLHIKKKKLKIK